MTPAQREHIVTKLDEARYELGLVTTEDDHLHAAITAIAMAVATLYDVLRVPATDGEFHTRVVAPKTWSDEEDAAALQDARDEGRR